MSVQATVDFPQPAVRRDPRALSTALLMAGIFLVAIFPTLRWLEFSNSTEGLNVATALEIRRTGHWLVPTLQGQTRLAKPPLPAWLTALFITPDVLENIQSGDHDTRDRAYTRLAVEVRSLALLAACGTMLATFGIGKVLFDADVGIVALIVVGTNILVLRFARVSATDIQLTLWVTVANLFFCKALFERRWTLGLIGGGTALALAMMSKGPVCLLQTIVPIAAYFPLAPRRAWPPRRPLLVGSVLFVVIGVAWYVLILLRVPHAWQIWLNELRGYPETNPRITPWYTYAVLLPYLCPWLAMFVAAAVVSARRFDPRDRLLLIMIIVPLVTMSLFHERFERYLLPIVPTCAVLTARQIVAHVRSVRWNFWERITNAFHWLLVAGLAIGFPLAAGGMVSALHRADGTAWLSVTAAWQAAIFSAAIITVAMLLQRRAPTVMILTTGILMLALQSLFMAGYTHSNSGRSEYRRLAEMVWDVAPNARVYNAHPRGKRPPTEVGVYLDRELTWVSDPARIVQDDRPSVLLMLQDKDQSPPNPGGAWQIIANIKGNERWWIFELPAKS